MDQEKNSRFRLLDRDEILSVVSRLSATGEFSFAQMRDTHTPEKIVLHRSIYRDYFSIALSHVFSGSLKISDEFRSSRLEELIKRFRSGQYDFVNLEPVNKIAKERSWVNPFGWDSDTNQIINPLTETFCTTAVLSIRLEFFHAAAVSGQFNLSEYEENVVRYINEALKSDEQNLGSGAAPVYDGIVQTQSQLVEYAIRIRAEFEDTQGRKMLRSDWDNILPDLRKLIYRKAVGSRVDSFKDGLRVCWSPKPFSISVNSSEGRNHIVENDMTEQDLAVLIDRLGHKDYVAAYSDQPITGCPVLHSRIGNGQVGYSANFVTLVTAHLLDAVANDFWPSSEFTQDKTCPYKSSRSIS
jgi:hypothetical protein